MKVILITTIVISTLIFGIRTIVRAERSNNEQATRYDSEKLIKFTDSKNDVHCYYVSGFPDGLSCVKL